MNKKRLENFSDGVIAILMTVLVMSLKAPIDYDTNDYSFVELLRLYIPQLIPYAVSFLVISVQLINHHVLLGKMHEVDNTFVWLNLLFLFSLSLIVFPTALFGYHQNKEASTTLLILAFLFKGFVYRLVKYYVVLKSNLYRRDSDSCNSRRNIFINAVIDPLIEVIALIFIQYNYMISLGIIFIMTLRSISPSKRV
ncbi:TMEM175 family protein [Halosquirtibacter xylanolyticus]|uniref:TMEM175 family protein n=1 Tax=Halosquirtibacter xylanolyticus TaxID=3374599 RepID=UPI003747955C|nr:TMEM175 family protein [Prolixibacteraceae bacterium]